MAKNIPILLQDALSKRSTSTAFLVKIRAVDGTLFGFTNCDTRLTIDDGIDLVSYSPTQELAPKNIQSTSEMTVDNTKLEGWFFENVEQIILAGKFDGAEISIYRVDYLQPHLGYEVMGYGKVGETDYNSDAKDKRKVEFRSLTQQLTQNANLLYSLTCRADYGDENCRMPFVWQSATVSAVGSSPQTSFSVTGINRPSGYFELGVVNFLDGPNAGADLEVESWDYDAATSTATVKLSYVAPYQVTVNTQLRFRQDCGKTETDCIAKGNIVNMQAEHLTPVEDGSLMVPGAYIKSQNAL